MATADLLTGALTSGGGGPERSVQAVLGGRIASPAETNPYVPRVLACRWPHVPTIKLRSDAAFGAGHSWAVAWPSQWWGRV